MPLAVNARLPWTRRVSPMKTAVLPSSFSTGRCACLKIGRSTYTLRIRLSQITT